MEKGKKGNPEEVRIAAALAMGGFPKEESIVRALAGSALQDSSPKVRAASLDSLGRLGAREVGKVFLVALKEDESPLVKATAAKWMPSIVS